jgi:hypothetical protein
MHVRRNELLTLLLQIYATYPMIKFSNALRLSVTFQGYLDRLKIWGRWRQQLIVRIPIYARQS